MHINQRKKLSAARETAFIALTCALMTGVQLALSAVPGVEFVTVILLCTSYVFGARFGCLTGLAFSLLRCLLFGFYPAVVAVYCIYFPLFGLLFGTIGRGDDGSGLTFKLKICVNLVLAALSAAAFAAAALELVKVSLIYRDAVYAMLWALGGIFIALAIAFDAVWLASGKKSGGERALRCFFVTALAALCTVAFTLIDPRTDAAGGAGVFLRFVHSHAAADDMHRIFGGADVHAADARPQAGAVTFNRVTVAQTNNPRSGQQLAAYRE